jgi:parallel beta-helix repeat protein
MGWAQVNLRNSFDADRLQTAQIPAGASVLYVNPVLGQDAFGRGGSDAAPLKTITYALQVAQPVTVIQLAPGSYTQASGEQFPLVIPSGIILRGDRSTQGQTVAIIGGGTFISPTFARQSVTLRPLDNSQISGVLVTNPNTRGTGIWVESTNARVEDSTFSNSLRDGIFVTGTGDPTIANNVFFNNDGNGISIARAARGTIRNNVLQNTGFGIAIGDTSAPTVVNNQVIENVDGIVISNSARPVLRNNVIQNNTRDGLVAIADARPDLGTADSPGGNIIRNNQRYDVYNATRNYTLIAIGNDIDVSRTSGLIEFVAATGTPSQFSDVQGNWAQGYIEALADLDIIGGFPDGTYRPDDLVTRAQFAAIINKAFEPSVSRSNVDFIDVASDFWGFQAIASAYQGGFMSGYPGGAFRPDESIPRIQVLVSLASGLALQTTNLSILSRYQDADQIPSWAANSVAAATQNNIVVNYPNVRQLNPSRNATRAEVAALVYQALVNAGKATPLPSPYLVNP